MINLYLEYPIFLGHKTFCLVFYQYLKYIYSQVTYFFIIEINVF